MPANCKTSRASEAQDSAQSALNCAQPSPAAKRRLSRAEQGGNGKADDKDEDEESEFSPSPPPKQAKLESFELILRRSKSLDIWEGARESQSKVHEDELSVKKLPKGKVSGSRGRRMSKRSSVTTAAMEMEAENLEAARSKKPKIINDCIHGTIEMPAVAMRIIDTRQFQRLRKLKQTGSCEMVYPNATHNRFQHSIGVAHLAKTYAEELRKQEKYGQSITDVDVKCILIAGLCHDLGHGPYSHLWEMFIKEANPEMDFHHEDISIQMLDHLLNKNELRPILEEVDGIEEKDILFIKELIAGPIDEKTGLPSREEFSDEVWPYRGRGEEKSFLYEIVANKNTGIDVDKWDYFLRDDYYLKIGHLFDYKRYMKFTSIVKTGIPPRKHLCIRDKEAENLKNMCEDRARLHKNGYQHRVSKIVDRMLIDTWLLGDKHVFVRGSPGGEKLRLSRAHEDMTAYECLTDEFVYHKIAHSDIEDCPDMDKARHLYARIGSRNFYADLIEINAEDLHKSVEPKPAAILKSLVDFWRENSNSETAANGAGEEQEETFDPSIHLTAFAKVVTSGAKLEKVFFTRKDGELSTAEPETLGSLSKKVTTFFVCVKVKKFEVKARDLIRKWMESFKAAENGNGETA